MKEVETTVDRMTVDKEEEEEEEEGRMTAGEKEGDRLNGGGTAERSLTRKRYTRERLNQDTTTRTQPGTEGGQKEGLGRQTPLPETEGPAAQPQAVG